MTGCPVPFLPTLTPIGSVNGALIFCTKLPSLALSTWTSPLSVSATYTYVPSLATSRGSWKLSLPLPAGPIGSPRTPTDQTRVSVPAAYFSTV